MHSPCYQISTLCPGTRQTQNPLDSLLLKLQYSLVGDVILALHTFLFFAEWLNQAHKHLTNFEIVIIINFSSN